MEILKNFLIGLVAIVVSFIFFIIILFIWPFLIGLGSLLLTFAAGLIFLILVFYIIVAIGYLVRTILKRETPKRDTPE